MPNTDTATTSFDTEKKRMNGTYSALPPSGWNCADQHEDINDEDVQPGDENFRVCYDNGVLVIIHDGDSYRGHISATQSDCTISETWKGIINVGLLLTHVLRTKTPGEYSLRLRELTDVEKEILCEYAL